MNLRRTSIAGLLALLMLPCFASTELLRIAPARTRVGLARVTLEISALRLAGDRLLGTYEVKVPLAPMMNDRGHIDLSVGDSLTRIMAERGIVRGTGHSVLDGRDHPITCRFGPERTVAITVDTGRRVLAFKTSYR